MSFPTITTPEMIHSIIEWTYFSSHYHSGLDIYQVSRQTDLMYAESVLRRYFDESPKYIAKFKDENQEVSRNIKIIDEPSRNNKTLKKEFLQLSYPVFKRLFSEFVFLAPHFESIRLLETKIKKSLPPEYSSDWNRVFKGGEGLFYSYENYEDEKKSEDINVKTIKAVSKEYRDITKKKHPNYGGMVTFRTLAFQIGFFNAFYTYCHVKLGYDSYDYYDEKRIETGLDEFLEKVNAKGLTFWVKFFTIFKEDYVTPLIGELSSKAWPLFQSLILRFIQDGTHSFYDVNNISPERHFLKHLVKNRVHGFTAENYSKNDQKHLTNAIVRRKHMKDFNKIRSQKLKQVQDAFLALGETAIPFNDADVLEEVINEKWKI